mmetsp:Transcript_48192/g.58346  ORF Transcript_48192/g.58346 Transcript_48192/m.58346 type:complete len:83 (+) Transcript_48192:36-284(+)
MTRYHSLTFVCLLIFSNALIIAKSNGTNEKVEYTEHYVDEFEDEEREFFLRFDVNDDGVLSRDEVSELMAAEYYENILNDGE